MQGRRGGGSQSKGGTKGGEGKTTKGGGKQIGGVEGGEGIGYLNIGRRKRGGKREKAEERGGGLNELSLGRQTERRRGVGKRAGRHGLAKGKAQNCNGVGQEKREREVGVGVIIETQPLELIDKVEGTRKLDSTSQDSLGQVKILVEEEAKRLAHKSSAARPGHVHGCLPTGLGETRLCHLVINGKWSGIASHHMNRKRIVTLSRHSWNHITHHKASRTLSISIWIAQTTSSA